MEAGFKLCSANPDPMTLKLGRPLPISGQKTYSPSHARLPQSLHSPHRFTDSLNTNCTSPNISARYRWSQPGCVLNRAQAPNQTERPPQFKCGAESIHSVTSTDVPPEPRQWPRRGLFSIVSPFLYNYCPSCRPACGRSTRRRRQRCACPCRSGQARQATCACMASSTNTMSCDIIALPDLQNQWK